jgi:O-antigen ligase
MPAALAWITDAPRPLHLGAGVTTLGLACAWLAPGLFWLLLAGLAGPGFLLLAWRFLPQATALWLVVTGLSPEMALLDLIGPESFQLTIAGLKAAQVGLATLCILRWGMDADPRNPALAFAAMAATGVVHGLHPGLSLSDSARSLAGSVAPFAFAFSRPSRAWGQAVIGAVRWIPLASALGGVILDLAGLRPAFIESGGWRLAGLGHPAFLGAVCLAALYAGLIEFFRTGSRAEAALLAANLLILVLTGARAPLFYAAVVILLSLLLAPSRAVPAHTRILVILATAAALPLVWMLADELAFVRLFNILSHETGNLSGRDLLWPFFAAAIDGSPWLGWGVGAGNVVIPPEGPIARLLHTWAAHNEYLRIEVEGGRLGLALLMLLFTCWIWRSTRDALPHERMILRLALLAFAAHAATDNLLISTPACVLFSLVTAVHARAVGRCHDEPEIPHLLNAAAKA